MSNTGLIKFLSCLYCPSKIAGLVPLEHREVSPMIPLYRYSGGTVAVKISTSVKLTGVFFKTALRTARSSWRNTLFQRNAILLHGMLTLGFTLPPFLLSFSTQPLPQRKIRCPVYLTFLTSKSGSRTTYFLLTMSTDQIKSCEVTPLVFTFLFFFIAGESSMDIDIWELLFLPKTTQMIFFFFFFNVLPSLTESATS